jgi:hypothetical protein
MNVRDLIIELCHPDYTTNLNKKPLGLVMRDSKGKEFRLTSIWTCEQTNELILEIEEDN